jgi:hypothetical protein
MTRLRMGWLGLLGAVLNAACGYSLAGRGDFLPEHIRIIGIPTFENLTDRVDIEEIFTEMVVQEFNSRGKYVVRPEEEGVDAVLSGKVMAFIVAPAVLEGTENEESADQASRYSIVVRAEVVFTDVVEKETIWSESNFSFRDEYEVGEDPDEFFDQEGMALERVAEDFAKTLVSRILEAF